MSKFDIGYKSDGKKFALPPEAVTETFAILGKRGSGKTSTGVVITEELIEAHLPVCILDPLDSWFGLRSMFDGKREGLPVVVIGGEHGDVPVASGDGATIADFVVDHVVNTVISLRHLSNSEQRSFVTAFAERLYDRKGEGKHRTPLHLVIDEADEYCPQRLFQGVERCFGAIDRIVRRGRSSGLGVTLISQRSAAINKDVLSQAEVLVAHRTISPQDRKAIEAWIEAHDAHDKHDEFMSSLASLEIGEAWFWSPGWLDIFERVKVRRRHTFDSSATPKAGSKPAEPVKLAAVDIEALKSKLAKTIEARKADDPRELKKKIADLECQLKNGSGMPSSDALAAAESRGYERSRKVIDALKRHLAVIYKTIPKIDRELDIIRRECDDMTVAGEVKLDQEMGRVHRNAPTKPVMMPQTSVRRAMGGYPIGDTQKIESGIGLGKCERAILAVLAQYPDGRSQSQIAIIAGYAQSGGFRNSIYSLRSAGLISGTQERLKITPAGVEAAGGYDPMPTGHELFQRWMTHKALGKCERQILECVVKADAPMSMEQIAQQAGYNMSGGFRNSIYKLRSLELISGKGDAILVSEELR